MMAAAQAPVSRGKRNRRQAVKAAAYLFTRAAIGAVFARIPQAAGQVGAVLAPGPAEAPWPQPAPRIASRQPPECWPDLMLPPSRIRDDGSTDSPGENYGAIRVAVAVPVNFIVTVPVRS